MLWTLGGQEEAREPLLDGEVPREDTRKRHQAPARSDRLLVLAAAVLGLPLMLWVLHPGALDLLLYGPPGGPPFCRKSTSIAVLPARRGESTGETSSPTAGSASAGGSDATAAAAAAATEAAGLELVVWSGIGKHKAIFDDMFSMDLATGAWRRLRPHGHEAPISRWKAGNAQAVDGGLVVVGGDAYTPHTFHHRYKHDVWRLNYERLEWEKAQADPDAAIMTPRRGQSTALYRGEDGTDRIVVFAGRTRDKVLLNDAWEVTLSWPNATWRLIAPQQLAGEDAPAPRRGHSAVMVPGGDGPQMLVYGGREDLDYFSDLWLLNVNSGKWRRIEPANEAPPGRDHHSVAWVGGKMVVWAGHSGPTYEEAKAVDDLLVFELATRQWHVVAQEGRKPLARFEQSYARYAPEGSTEPHLLIFGGQTEHVCQLNDVWDLDLSSYEWRELSKPVLCTKDCRKRYGRC